MFREKKQSEKQLWEAISESDAAMNKAAKSDDSPDEDTAVKEEDLQRQLEEKNKQCNELLDQAQRTLAEFDNFRKRTAKEKSSMYDAGLRDTVEKLLPIIDNFDRALSSNREDSTEDGFYKGVEMIVRQFSGFLEELGVEIIPGVGQSFDPTLHFAVSHVEDESYGENEIIEELQKGYKHKDKVIRASMVKVAN